MARKRITLLLSAAALGWTVAGSADIALAPETACALLADQRLGGVNYHAMGDATHRCASPRRVLPYGGDVQNEMQFQAWGDAAHVNRLELRFAIASRGNLQPTLSRMARLGETLSQRAVSRSLPETIREAILAATPAQAVAGGLRFTVLRQTAGFGGQTLVLRIE